MADPNAVQEVGDFTVTPFPGGHLIGQLRAKVNHSFGWDYVANESNTQRAIQIAKQRAREAKKAAWMYEPDGTYLRIPLGPPHSD